MQRKTGKQLSAAMPQVSRLPWNSVRRRRVRAGISLMEILISMGLFMVGLLGIAAMLPLASRDILDATQRDLSTVIGRRGIQEVGIRQLYNPGQWRGYDASAIVPTTGRPMMSRLVFDWPVIIDPLYVAQHAELADGSGGETTYAKYAGVFPVPNRAEHQTQVDNDLNNNTITYRIGTRVTLDGFAGADIDGDGDLDFASRADLARRIFASNDDLSFVLPVDETDRPRHKMLCTGEQGGTVTPAIAPWPPRFSDDDIGTNSAAIAPVADNEYSWIAVVVPERVELLPSDPLPNVYLDTPERLLEYSVSVAVFHRRETYPPLSATDSSTPDEQLSAPAERRVTVQFLGNGMGGGEALLYLNGTDPSSYLDLRVGDFIMVFGTRRTQRVAMKPIVHWYRVVGVGELDESGTLSGTPERYVTLVGPDWVIDNDKNGTLDPAAGVIVKGVIGVRTAKFQVAK